jgi:uncharacterized spore protein YtfJ
VLGEQNVMHAEGPRRRADALIEAVVDRIGGGEFGTAKVFGDPVEREGVTVIPVAAVRMGFGGGTRSDPGKRHDGEGAGGGGAITAAGYIELKQGTSRFVPVLRPERMAAMLLGAVLAGMMIGSRRGRSG